MLPDAQSDFTQLSNLKFTIFFNPAYRILVRMGHSMQFEQPHQGLGDNVFTVHNNITHFTLNGAFSSEYSISLITLCLSGGEHEFLNNAHQRDATVFDHIFYIIVNLMVVICFRIIKVTGKVIVHDTIHLPSLRAFIRLMPWLVAPVTLYRVGFAIRIRWSRIGIWGSDVELVGTVRWVNGREMGGMV